MRYSEIIREADRTSLAYEEKLKDMPLHNQVEWYILGFSLYRPEMWNEIRKLASYTHRMPIAIALAKALGVHKAAEIFSAAHRYTSNQYARMNNSLRAGAVPRSVPLIDNYVKYAPKTDIDVMYRGVGAFFETLKIEDEFVDNAFVSVSSNPRIAATFGKKKGRILKIHGVAGKAVPTPEDSESEYLLPRGSKFKVLEVNGNEAIVQLL